MSNKLGISEIKERLFSIYGDTVSLDFSTYVDIKTKCRFIHSLYGEWFALPLNVLRGRCGPEKQMKRNNTSMEKYGVKFASQSKSSKEKQRLTNIEKYGVDHPLKNKEISLKSAKNSNNVYVKYHWKTGQELVCQGSYESKVVDVLNAKKIDFEWQPKTFIMPNGKTYRPDLFLSNENKWIEIKGFMRKDAQIKWDWFHKNNPNSQLWDKKTLTILGFL